MRVKLFYYLIGENGSDLLNTVEGGSVSVRQTLSSMMALFGAHCYPKLNETVERSRFFVRNQRPDEYINKYVTDVKVLAIACNFGDIKGSLMRDHVFCDTNSSAMGDFRKVHTDMQSHRNVKGEQQNTARTGENTCNTERVNTRERHSAATFVVKHTQGTKYCAQLLARHIRSVAKNHFAAKCKSQAE